MNQINASGPKIWWEEGVNLHKDGDPLEKLWWPLLEKEFEPYELFWRRHIVPLTNRINGDESDPEKKIAFREDSRINDHVEKMAMAQYSTFYFFSRASLIILHEPHLYIEDAFLFLDFSFSNLERFIHEANHVLKKCGLPGVASVPDRETWDIVKLYRNIYAHGPLIGRSYNWLGHIPKPERLIKNGRTNHKWSQIQALDRNDLVEARAFLKSLRKSLLRKLNDVWKQIEERLTGLLRTDSYRNYWGLDQRDCIAGKEQPPKATEINEAPDVGRG